MNERIQQLAEQAGFEITPWGDELLPCVHQEGPIYEELEKFAELIVRECVDIVEDYGLSLVGGDENYLGETLNLSIRVQEAGNKIKEHFGVEE
jgi:hypothetical protein